MFVHNAFLKIVFAILGAERLGIWCGSFWGNPNHLDRPSGEWETKAKNPLTFGCSKINCFSKGHVGCVIYRKGSNLRRRKNPARLRPGRLGCRSSDLRHFPRDIRIISIWILFKHLSLSCWSIHSRTLVSHARRQQSFVWFGLSFCNCEEAEDSRGWTDVGSISVYSEFNPPIPVDMIDFGLDILLELWRSKLHDGKTDRTSWLNI